MVSGSPSAEERGGGSNRPSRSVATYEELFDECCPVYMAMGMSYDDFWNGDCAMVRAYRRYDEIKQERQNETAWLQGVYICEAIAASFSKKAKYPTEPHPLKTEISEKRKQARQEANERKAVDYLMTFTAQWNKRFAAKQKETADGKG